MMTEQHDAGTGKISASAKKPRKAAAGAGHNQPPAVINGNADDRLRLLIERIERLEEEKKGIGDDIKDVYNEAKATGYDAKIMRKIVRLRKMKPDDRREAEALIILYCDKLGIETQGCLF
jgi:uncharacterized protein (UPF0335 family)